MVRNSKVKHWAHKKQLSTVGFEELEGHLSGDVQKAAGWVGKSSRERQEWR